MRIWYDNNNQSIIPENFKNKLMEMFSIRVYGHLLWLDFQLARELEFWLENFDSSPGIHILTIESDIYFWLNLISSYYFWTLISKQYGIEKINIKIAETQATNTDLQYYQRKLFVINRKLSE